MDESKLLAHIFDRTRSEHSAQDIIVGPGDDCAVIAGNPQLLLTVDQLIQGRHFHPSASVEDIAFKAVARAASDIAAMAGTPTASLGAAALPSGYPQPDKLFDAVHHAAQHIGCPMIGGDIARTKGPLALTITVIGRPHTTRGPVLRAHAQPHDAVFVTGRLGGAVSSGRHLRPPQRFDIAQQLASTLDQSLGAMIDLSDGLGLDAARVALASGVRIELQQTAIPLAEHTNDLIAALAEGEDYELCFTVRAPDADRLPAEIAGIPITRIGHVAPGSGCVLVPHAGPPRDISRMGFEHGR